MRESPLKAHPETHHVGMRDVIGVANAVERETNRRYGQLAELMDHRGEHATAAAFRGMLNEGQKHVATLERMAAALGETLPPAEDLEWRLPTELLNSWDEAAGSALLTPFRAFAIAVKNEERAFSLYAYLAAHAADTRVRSQAESLAAEALEHAALLRRWRREAYHREGRTFRREPQPVNSVEQLDALLSDRESAIAGCYLSLAERLRQLGDIRSALLLLDLLEKTSRPPGPAKPCSDADCRADTSLKLLVAAQKPLEALAEELEAILGAADERLAPEVEKALSNVTARLARIALQIELQENAQRT